MFDLFGLSWKVIFYVTWDKCIWIFFSFFLLLLYKNCLNVIFRMSPIKNNKNEMSKYLAHPFLLVNGSEMLL